MPHYLNTLTVNLRRPLKKIMILLELINEDILLMKITLRSMIAIQYTFMLNKKQYVIFSYSARIFASFSSCAHETGVQYKEVAESSLSKGRLAICLT